MSGAKPRQVGNLSSELSSFIGRRWELGEVKRRLQESRLVTLTGPGGTGKTRLASRVGAELRRAFADEVWFVDLTELREAGLNSRNVHDPDVLAFLVTATLGLREQGSGPPLGRLVEQLAGRRMLLILDNCEHLIPACAVLVDALLCGCPELRVMATSREPLAITGEMLVGVSPLSAPDLDDLPSLVGLGRYESVALFLARAESAAPGFGLSEGDHLAVAELCHRLDGLPLGIELAAAWVPVLGPRQILARLTDRFALLSRGSSNAPERQHTLRTCVDWSFDLCAKPERMLWARLSVFAGAFELDAVEGICADEHLPEVDLLDLVTGLVDKSILVRDDVRDDHGEAARYRMLETIRDYGREQLVEAGDGTLLCRRHRDWYQRLVAHAAELWISDRQPYWMARLGREHPNLRAAVQFCLTEPGEAEAALRLAVSLPRSYWPALGAFGEGRRWLDRGLDQATAPTALRARALLVNSFLAFVQGDAATGRRLFGEGEDLARHLDAGTELAFAAYLRGMGALYAGDLSVAVQTLTRAWTALARTPDRELDLSLSLLLVLGVATGLAGEYERATACVREMLSIAEPGGGRLYPSFALWMGGLIAWRQGDLDQAAAQLVKSLQLKRAWDLYDRYGTALCLEVLAWIMADQQRHRQAATLLGAADVRWTDVGTPITALGHLIGYHTACERQARDALGDATFQQALHEGQVLTYDDVLAYAPTSRDNPVLAPPPEDAPTRLTHRPG